MASEKIEECEEIEPPKTTLWKYYCDGGNIWKELSVCLKNGRYWSMLFADIKGQLEEVNQRCRRSAKGQEKNSSSVELGGKMECGSCADVKMRKSMSKSFYFLSDLQVRAQTKGV